MRCVELLKVNTNHTLNFSIRDPDFSHEERRMQDSNLLFKPIVISYLLVGLDHTALIKQM